MDKRTRSAGSARCSCRPVGTLACDMQRGKLTVEFTLPKLTVIAKMRVDSTTRRESSSDPVSKLNTEPEPRDCKACRAKPGWSVRPG